jgi:phage shock protein PspC (stress-responsive transcriptional regulator)
MNRRLYRSPDDRVLAGVAGGMAETYDFDPSLVRIAWALLILVTGGLFLLLYIVMALVVPLRPYGMAPWAANQMATMPGTSGTAGAPGPDGTPPGPEGVPTPGGTMPGPGPMSTAPDWSYRRHRRNDAAGPIVIGLVLIIAGIYFLARQYIPAFNWSLIWPIFIIGGGLLLILFAFGRTRANQ